MRFLHRSDAGRQLADRLERERLHQPVVLALPRGGVPVAYEVAARLRAPLDVFVARKIGTPGHPELGMGAIAEGGTMVVGHEAAEAFGITDERMRVLAAEEQQELERRVRHYRGDRQLPDLRGRDVVVIDDGLATGVTAEAALRALRARGPARLLLAVPVCAPDTAQRLGQLAEVVCVSTPPDFRAVGLWYQDFTQTTDETVLELLERGRDHSTAAGRP